ncbi:MAG: hypothetical protein R2818_02175 [Flavobacteriales bacterium]
MFHVLETMGTIRSILLGSLLLGSTAGAQDGTLTRLSQNLKAIASAPSDAIQDSLNAVIETDLRALLDAKDAFSNPFTGVPITKVDSPDSTFRLFTWNLPRKDGTHSYRGFLLTRTNRTSTLFELRDQTDRIPSPEVPELGPERWYGALYYEVIPVNHGGKRYYTLLGWKGYSRAETRKVIEVLSFRNGKPRFGAPLFGRGKIKAMRKVYGYSFQASMTLRYEPELEAIIMDHLAPPREELKGQAAFYGPDMTHDGYFWHKGEWWFGPNVDLRDKSEKAKPFNAPPPSVGP